jgi:(S)-3,5-dihydroxyphenylglycine transaminase
MTTDRQAMVIKFLNEVADDYPSAISLATGRPTDRFSERLGPAAILGALSLYQQSYSKKHANAQARLLQYGPTHGIINDLIAENLRVDETIPATSDRVLITSGCQEALTLCISCLCPAPDDVLLVCNPTYAGAVGAARASGVTVHSVPINAPSLAVGIAQAYETSLHRNRQPRAIYLIPTFDNPTGRVLDEMQRRAILQVCATLHLVILEDNPYGMFRYDGDAVRTLASLDCAGSVVYLSTFSKTMVPTLRVGAVTLPETLFGDRTASLALWNSLVQRKSLLTINTSQISQAIVGGILLDEQCTLQRWILPALDWYRANRDTMLRQLGVHFAPISNYVRWNHPAGGFFLSLELPFPFDAYAAAECAGEEGVIVMPMCFFSSDSAYDNMIRLSFSSVEPQQICDGIQALAHYVRKRIELAA